MIHDQRQFDTHPFPAAIDADPSIERITIRRGRRYRPDAHLTGDEIGKLAVAGAIVATVIAFAIDAHGALEALRSIVGR